MRYLGGKARLAKKLVPYIERELAQPGVTAYYEPFMGGGSVFCAVSTTLPKYGTDLHPELMALWVHVRDGGELPDTVTEADYARAKAGDGPAWWRGFVGFGCSFGGKWMGGFARQERGDGFVSFAAMCKRVLLKQRAGLLGSTLGMYHFQVAAMWADRAVIYCDPPYAATTGYQRGGFDHDLFWRWARSIATHNIVLISEYAAPGDIPCIATFQQGLKFCPPGGTNKVRTEKLFRLAPEWAPYGGPL